MTLRDLSQLHHLEREIRELQPLAQDEDIAEMIESLTAKRKAEKIALLVWINNIDDSYLRQIFTNRFVNGYSWQKVAMRCGGNVSPQGAFMMCKRYIDAENVKNVKKT